MVAAAGGVLAIALASAGAVLGILGQPVDKDPGSLVMNLVLVVTFPVVAVVVARHRPGHRLVWLFSFVALGAAVTVFTYGYARYGLETAPGAVPGAPVIAWASTWVWVGGVMPLVTFGVLLFPDGRLPSPRWWPAAAAAGLSMVSMVLAYALRPGALVDHPVVDNPVGVPWLGPTLETVESGALLLFMVAFMASASSQVVRWRRGSPRERRQLRWLVYAVSVVALGFVVDALANSLVSSLVVATAVAFLPVAVGIAIVHEHLYDVDLLIRRSLVYAALTAGVVGTYVAVVTGVGAVLGSRAELVGPLLATGIVAVAFQPAREAIQNRVSWLVYGAAADPHAARAELARRLDATTGTDALLPVVVEAVATTLRLPYVAIELAEDGSFRRVAAHGDESTATDRLLLTHQTQTIGRLVIGRRGPREGLTSTERRLLEDFVREAGIAVHGVRLTAALQGSRERLVIAREEERRRLHRDLHDGLGPTLAAMTLQLDVLRRQITLDPARAAATVDQLKQELRTAIPEIRRLVDALRPPALDELGLVAALRQQAASIGATDGSVTGLTVTIEAPQELPGLGAATEVAAYRIVMEAMTNVVRHAGAHRCTVRLACPQGLDIEVEDDGAGIPARPPVGVGLNSMRERAAELGGHCVIGTREGAGTLVRARLPLTP
jgi:signal transduction histidine kinase